MKSATPKKIAILNLAGDLSPELDAYFKKQEILIVAAEYDSKEHEWTHIITVDVHDFTDIAEAHETVANDVKIISLSSVIDPQSFVSANGRLLFDQKWLGSSIGIFILDKFFQEFGGISPSDSYPKFQELGSFNITNPFSTGEFTDRLVFHAFESGMEGLAVKTFFDHLTMFLAGLKAKGMLGWPVEVSYGKFDDVFGLQLNFFTPAPIMDYITSCMSEVLSRKTEEYLLNLTIQSSDFFDFTYLSDVRKAVITGIWTNDERIRFENRGMMFTELGANAKITNYPSQGVTSVLIDTTTPEDISFKVNLPQSEGDKPFEFISAETIEETGPVTIAGTPPEKELVQTVGGGNFEEEEFQQKISGGTQEKETAQVVKGTLTKEDPFKVSIQGQESEESDIMIIKGSPVAAKKGLLQVRESANPTPLTPESDLILMKGSKPQKAAPLKLKTLGTSEGVDVTDDLFIVPATAEEKGIAQPKGMFDELRVKNLNNMPVETAQSRDAFVKHLPQPEKIVVAGDPEREKQLEIQLKTAQVENEMLKSKMKTLLTEVKIIKESKAKLAEINQKIAESGTITDENKRIQIESAQKENFFMQELEKAQRQIKAKELMIEKNREMATKMIEKKSEEIIELQSKVDQLNSSLLQSGTHPQQQANQIKVLERETENQQKMIEMYKTKVASLTANLERQQTKDDEVNFKEENRRLSMLNIQMKNQLDAVSKEVERLQEKSTQDTTLVASLKSEKLRIEQLLKKSTHETKKSAETGVSKIQHDIEVKRLTTELTRMEHVLKEAQKKTADLEARLQAASSAKSGLGGDEVSKGKVLQLETSLKRLTQDLIQSKNDLAEMKKESNKLRQDKTALQNQLDRAKKDLERANKAQKPGGKAA